MATTRQTVETTFAWNLKESRRRSGLTMREVAAKLDIKLQRYLQWEQGLTQPNNLYYLVQLSELFNLSLDIFLKKELPYDRKK